MISLLQWDRGLLAADGDLPRLCRTRGRSASMGPRLVSRGWAHGVGQPRNRDPPSMGPRLVSRGWVADRVDTRARHLVISKHTQRLRGDLDATEHRE